jgi:hypothetical protein
MGNSELMMHTPKDARRVIRVNIGPVSGLTSRLA